MQAKQETGPSLQKMPLFEPPTDPGNISPRVIQRFMADLNAHVTDLNALIDTYEAIKDTAEKIRILQEIQAIIQQIDSEFPDVLIALLPAYLNKHAVIFKEIQEQYRHLGVESLVRDSTSPSVLTEVIANMSPEKADTLLSMLLASLPPPDPKKIVVPKSGAMNQKLINLYAKEDNSPEAVQFRQFLKSHTITFLGGNNSRNFIVVPLAMDQPTLVLKVENRLGGPKDAENHLRKLAPDLLAPVYADRLVSTGGGNTENYPLAHSDSLLF